MKKTYKISKKGIINGLWDDMLSAIPGNKEIERASNVEFNTSSQKWGVTLLINSVQRTAALTFKNRKEAIAYEIEILNKLLVGESIEGYF